MNVELTTQSLSGIEADALVLMILDREPTLSGAAGEIDRVGGGAIAEMIESGEFSARALEMTIIVRPAGLRARRLLLLGCGKAHSGVSFFELWKAAATATRHLKSKGFHRVAFAVPSEWYPQREELGWAIQAMVTGVSAGNFDSDFYKSDRKPDRQITGLVLALPANRSNDESWLRGMVRRAEIVADGHAFARSLANEPGNYLTPTRMGERAKAMADDAGLACELIDRARARELKMGAFLSVAQGSAEPPVMILLRYFGDPEGMAAPFRLGIIGKGITFDSGGISIKPAAGMEWMKFDMSGGAATLGAMKAIAALKPRINILAIVPATENMPGGRAQKPGDVQTAMSGKTIEVLNTDAEGRLVLADALCYARELGATHLIDSATLTGAIVISLGHVNTGVFTNNEELHAKFARAAKRSGEKMWRMPMDAEYTEQIRGTIGDILNTGGRYGGAITAAKFLEEFVGDTPWIHLDIAGTAWVEDNKPWMPAGPTGTPVYSLIELADILAG